MVEPNPIINDILSDISKTESTGDENRNIRKARKFIYKISEKYNLDETQSTKLIKQALDQWEENFNKLQYILNSGPYEDLLNAGRITQEKYEKLLSEYEFRYSEIRDDILGGDDSEYDFRYNLCYNTNDLNRFIRYAHPDKIFIEEITPSLRQIILTYADENYTLKDTFEALLFGGFKRKHYELSSSDEENNDQQEKEEEKDILSEFI